jgi:DNA-binding PadR family transcriptional regulator
MFGHRKSFGAAWLGSGLVRGGFGRHHHGWGRGGPWGGRHFGPFGGPEGKRRFGRGDLKYVILDLVKDQPRHGYDIIKALEERFYGFYSPSPGSVYPTLQLLEDQGLVSSSEQDGKRVYVITDEGRKFLTEQEATMKDLHARMAEGWGPMANPEMRELVGEVRQLGQFLFRQGAHGGLGDPEKVRRLRDIVARARTEIEAVFSEDTVTTV